MPGGEAGRTQRALARHAPARVPPPLGRPSASVHTGPARPRRPLPGSQAARLRPRPPPARPRSPAPRAAAERVPPPPPPLAAARSGPLRHRRPRPIDPSRGAVDSGAHGPQSRACFARSPRVVPLVPTPLRRAARSSPVVNGRTERRKIEGAGSRHRCALDTPGRIAAGAPTPPLSRGRPPRRLGQSALLACRVGCRLCRARSLVIPFRACRPSKFDPST